MTVYQCDAGNRNYLRFSQYFPRYGGATGQVGLVVNGFSFAFFFFSRCSGARFTLLDPLVAVLGENPTENRHFRDAHMMPETVSHFPSCSKFFVSYTLYRSTCF